MGLNRRSLLKLSGYFGAASLAPLFKSPLSQAAQSPGQSPMSNELTMQMDWVYNVQFAGLLLADHLGLYGQNGLTVKLKPWASGMVVPQEVVETPMTIGCSEQNLILEAQANGAPIKAIATMFQASPYALMAMPDSGISALDDLVGKKVGIHIDGIKVMELVKGVNNLPPDAIEVIEIPYENKLDRLISGEFAAIQCYAVDEPIAFKQKVGQEPILLPMDQYGYKAYAQVFFTTDTVLQTAPDQVKQFLAASFDGWRRAFADIPATARLIAETYAEPGSKYTNVDYQQQSLQLVQQYVMRGISEAQLGTILPQQWQQTADLMAQYGIIDASPEVEKSLELSLWSASS